MIDYTPLRVVLPPQLADFFKESGYTVSGSYEDRTSARLRIREIVQVNFLYQPMLTQHVSDLRQEHGTALLKDISKYGVGILYHQQMFPEEQFEVLCHGRSIQATVVRCRKLGEYCFEIGGLLGLVQSIPSVERSTC